MFKIDDLFELSEKTKDGMLESIIDFNVVPLNEKESIKKMLSDSVIVDADFSYHKELNYIYNENLISDCIMLLKLQSNQYAIVGIESSYWLKPEFAPNWHDNLMVLRFGMVPDDIVRAITR